MNILKIQDILNDWVSKCDVIVHLAALNRHNDPEVIYQNKCRIWLRNLLRIGRD